ncbi:MAG: hypothetical protein CMI09_02175 [Oceanospirillaceae bacterium]|nr:hypothetical protein [Oceanospirillaceae bacterium]|tara:strand:+ start:174 stop:638 length:465 start_codon:yes stop_codon:yes gene_type:complete
MNYPHFIAIDPSSHEETSHPIAIAWSMSDGQIKTTLIQPEDDWEDWDYALEDLHGINQDTLYQRGETCWSVLREMENDLEESYLRSDDFEQVERLLGLIYEACGKELSLETGSYREEISDQALLKETQEQLYNTHLTCDDRVLLMLKAWAEANA